MKVLLIVLAVLLFLLLLPFGAAVRYDESGLTLWAKVLFFKLKLSPLSPEKKAKKEAKKKAKKEKKAQKTEKKAKEKPKEKPKEKRDDQKTKKGGKLDLVRSALPLIKPALSGVRKRLTIRDLELHVTWGADNPADAAVGYGRANAALGALWPVIDQNFKVKKSRLGCDVDFNGSKPTVYLFAALTLNLWKVLTLVIPLAIRFFIAYSKLHKKDTEESTKKEA